MIRATLLATVTLATTACSMLSLGYNRLPDLAGLWLQRQVPLAAAQQEALDQDLRQLLAWHRQTQLRPTADLLRRWQGLAPTDLSADQLCHEFEQVRDLFNPISDEAVPALTKLARGLDAAQLQALANTQREGHAKFRNEHLTPTGNTPAAHPESHHKRFDNANDRYAMLYGRLNTAQQAALRQAVAQSVFQAARSLAERERRTQDLLATIGAVQATPSDAEATALVRGWLQRLQSSPTPGYPAYAKALTREACEQMATVHRLATPAQRQQAASTLTGYESELRQLASR